MSKLPDYIWADVHNPDSDGDMGCRADDLHTDATRSAIKGEKE